MACTLVNLNLPALFWLRWSCTHPSHGPKPKQEGIITRRSNNGAEVNKARKLSYIDTNLDLDTTVDYSPDNKLDLTSLIQRTIKESLEPFMPGLIQEPIKGVMAVITDQLAVHKQEITRIEQDVASTHERLNTVVTSVDHLENKVDEIEQERRASSVIFSNKWPESPTESAQSFVRKYTHKALHIDLNDNEIIKCFRLGRRSNRSSKPWPILVSFASTSTKTEGLLASRRIRNFVSVGFPRPVSINEDLTLRR